MWWPEHQHCVPHADPVHVASCEGVYHFRFHADYGYGGFLGIDGVSHSAGDIWGHVFARDVAITEGDHYWESLGFEGCCDGHSEIEIHLPGDAVTDPWRPITSGASSDLEGDCGAATPPPAPPPSGDSTAGCEYSVYGENDDYDTMSMAAGEDFCIQIGGHLASAHSQEDGDAIETLVTGNTAWIGYHDMGFEAGCTDDRHQGIGGNIAAATFVWTDSTPSDYENWAGGEPNDWQDGAAQCDGTGNEDCTETWQSGATWNDANCDGSKAVVCQVCPFTHANNPTSFQYFADGLPKPAAEFQCIIRGGHLASLHSEDDSQLLDDMIDANGGGSTWIGYHDRAAEAGCTDDRHEGIGGLIEAVTFIWTDGTASDYEDWAGGEPNDWQAGQARCDGTGNEDCTEIWRSGQDWNDANCDGTKPYICGFAEWADAACTFTFFGDSKSMRDANDACIEDVGGHLASAHSQGDSDAFNTLIDDNGGGSTWIGYHDMGFEAGCTDDRHEGIGGNIQATSFVWTDGSPSDYENWAGGEPNDWQAGAAQCDGTGNEDCTEIWRSGQDWNDANCDGTKPYICGACPVSSLTPTYYEYVGDSLSKPDAEFQCIINGGHLASLHSEADSDLLDDLIDGNGGGSTWIGYHDRAAEAGCTDDRHQGIGGNIESASFVWTDGTASDYEDWAGGEPNDWQAGQARCDGSGNEDCTEIWRSGQDWNDANCDGTKPYICGYITSGAGPDMCSGVRPTDAGGNQLITFGCIDHETVQCTYNANDGGGDYAASMAAFADCRTASEGAAGYCRGELSEARWPLQPGRLRWPEHQHCVPHADPVHCCLRGRLPLPLPRRLRLWWLPRHRRCLALRWRHLGPRLRSRRCHRRGRPLLGVPRFRGLLRRSLRDRDPPAWRRCDRPVASDHVWRVQRSGG